MNCSFAVVITVDADRNRVSDETAALAAASAEVVCEL
jgi:hypothetical protein